jgi:hypothetical protein
VVTKVQIVCEKSLPPRVQNPRNDPTERASAPCNRPLPEEFRSALEHVIVQIHIDMASTKKAAKATARVKFKDLGAKKNPKGGTLSVTECATGKHINFVGLKL